MKQLTVQDMLPTLECRGFIFSVFAQELEAIQELKQSPVYSVFFNYEFYCWQHIIKLTSTIYLLQLFLVFINPIV